MQCVMISRRNRRANTGRSRLDTQHAPQAACLPEWLIFCAPALGNSAELSGASQLQIVMWSPLVKRACLNLLSTLKDPTATPFVHQGPAWLVMRPSPQKMEVTFLRGRRSVCKDGIWRGAGGLQDADCVPSVSLPFISLGVLSSPLVAGDQNDIKLGLHNHEKVGDSGSHGLC